MVVFPKPVISETRTELLMVNSLANTRKAMETSRIAEFPINPNSSNRLLPLVFQSRFCLPYDNPFLFYSVWSRDSFIVTRCYERFKI
jgi:hypothetical protein